MNITQLHAQLSAEFGGPAIGAWPTNPGQKLQPHKGGDGGAADAKAAEADRQARITAATNRINSIFDDKEYNVGKDKVSAIDPSQRYFNADGTQWHAPIDQQMAMMNAMQMASNAANGLSATGLPGAMYDRTAMDQALQRGLYAGVETVKPTQTRQQLYDQQKTAVFDINKRDVDKQFKEAERATRFGLARSGLTGGREDIDAKAKLQDINNEGLIRAAGLGDAAAADLKTADERARQGLISMAQSGIDTGTAQTMAMRQLDATAQDAAGTRSGATIGNLFADLGKAYVTNQTRAGMQAGMNNSYDQRYPNLATSRGDSGSVYR